MRRGRRKMLYLGVVFGGLVTVLLGIGTAVRAQGAKYGLTWSQRSHNVALGTDFVGCGTDCNPYDGDTSCDQSLPILCIKKNGEPNPGVTPYDSYYYGWTGGHVATTPAVQGSSLGSIENANAICASQFGSGWQMAEFHDANGGWNWHATGNVRSDTRFWVYINDQSNGNCW